LAHLLQKTGKQATVQVGSEEKMTDGNSDAFRFDGNGACSGFENPLQAFLLLLKRYMRHRVVIAMGNEALSEILQVGPLYFLRCCCCCNDNHMKGKHHG